MLVNTLCGLAAVAQSVKLHIMKVGEEFQVVIEPSMQLAEKFPALAQPLMVTASQEKLEAEVITALTSFTPMVQTASNNLAQIQENLDSAQKAAREKGKKTTPVAPAKPGSSQGTTTTNGVKPPAAMEKATETAPDLFSSSSPSDQNPPPAGTGSEPTGSTEEDLEDDLPTFPGM
jgi:PRTRC genetic system protein E